MLCDNYLNGLENQPGNQPIRVFGERFGFAFENIRIELKSPPHNNKSIDEYEMLISYGDEKLKGPSTNGRGIYIQESFLSFLWCYCYGLLVSAPMKGKSLTSDEYKETIELLKYALSLFKNYTIWEKEILPNPELHGKDEKCLIGRSNACFWYAFNYILYHEFAHVSLGHFDKLRKSICSNEPLSNSHRIELEMEADIFALDRIREKLVNTKHEFSANIGIIAALGSITFTSRKFSGGKNHPDPDHRLRLTLEKINAPEDDYCWGFALWSFLIWEQHFEALHQLWPTRNPNASLKAMFYESLKNLDKLKKERA